MFASIYFSLYIFTGVALGQIPGSVFKFTKYGSYPAENTHCVSNKFSPPEWQWPNVPGPAGDAFRQGKWIALTQVIMDNPALVPTNGAATGTKTPGCGKCVRVWGKTKAGKDFNAGPFVVADMCNTTPGNPWYDENCLKRPNNIDSTDPLFNEVADDSCGEVFGDDNCGSVEWKFVDCVEGQAAPAPQPVAPAPQPAPAPCGTKDVDGKQIPICQQAVPNPTLDTQGRKWGWENNVSCIVDEHAHDEL